MGMDEAERLIEEALESGSTELYLHQHRLRTVPAALAELTDLRTLFLGDNQLTTVPAELARLTNLESLHLDGNQLTTVPAELAQLTNLQVLSLTDNRLTTIPAELGRLTNLQLLRLGGNQLTTVPAELARLTNLEELWLNGNRLTWLPHELSAIPGLTNVSLRRRPQPGERLMLGANRFAPELLAAAEAGAEQLWDYLRTHEPPVDGRPATRPDEGATPTDLDAGADPLLEPVEVVDDPIERTELRREVEKLLGSADKIVADGLVDDELELEKVRALAQALRVLVLYSDDVDPGYALESVYGLIGELARVVAQLDPEQGPTDRELVDVVTGTERTDPNLPGEIGDLLERRTDGRITRAQWLAGVAAGGGVLGIAGLVADVGLAKALGAGMTSVGAVVLVLVLTSWRRR